MWNNVWSYFLSLYTVLYNAVVPCTYPELLPANKVDLQQYLGKWYFQVAVSHREHDVQVFKELDSLWFDVEATANDTLLLTGHFRVEDNCVKQTWTYRIHPDRDDLELEGHPKRRSLLWSGKWLKCPECIILQDIEPPLSPTDSEDSLSRFMLYARQRDVGVDVATTFVENVACHPGYMMKNVTLPRDKGCCRSHGCLDETDAGFPGGNELINSAFTADCE